MCVLILHHGTFGWWSFQFLSWGVSSHHVVMEMEFILIINLRRMCEHERCCVDKVLGSSFWCYELIIKFALGKFTRVCFFLLSTFFLTLSFPAVCCNYSHIHTHTFEVYFKLSRERSTNKTFSFPWNSLIAQPINQLQLQMFSTFYLPLSKLL